MLKIRILERDYQHAKEACELSLNLVRESIEQERNIEKLNKYRGWERELVETLADLEESVTRQRAQLWNELMVGHTKAIKTFDNATPKAKTNFVNCSIFVSNNLGETHTAQVRGKRQLSTKTISKIDKW